MPVAQNGDIAASPIAPSFGRDIYPPDDGSQAFALIHRAQLMTEREDDMGAIEACSAAIAAARDMGATKMEIWALTMQATSSAVIGLRKEAMDLATQALSLARAQEDVILEARALFAIGFVALETHDDKHAQKVLERSLTCAEAGGSAFDAFWALNNLSHIHGMAAERAKPGSPARDAAMQALAECALRAFELSRTTGIWSHRCYALLNLANAAYLRGAYRDARAGVLRFARLARANQSPRLMALANLDMARLLAAEGDLPGAIAMIDTHVHHDHLCNTDDLRLQTQDKLAEFYRDQGDFAKAYAHLAAARCVEQRMQAYRTEQQIATLTAKIEVEEARAEAARLKVEASMLEQRNLMLEQDRAALARDAECDALTGLGNRRAADKALTRQMQGPAAARRAFCLAYLDVDLFKTVNDTFGHEMGDRVLMALADVLRAGVRPADDVFRLGGEEFVILLRDEPLNNAAEICERLRAAVAGHDWAALHPDLKVTVSIGVACHGEDIDRTTLLARADAALYRAKESGRNRVVLA